MSVLLQTVPLHKPNAHLPELQPCPSGLGQQMPTILGFLPTLILITAMKTEKLSTNSNNNKKFGCTVKKAQGTRAALGIEEEWK